MYCEKCEQTFENHMQCPDCGARLVYPSERRSGERDMSAFAGSDAFRWKKQVSQTADGPAPARSSTVMATIVFAVLAVVAAVTAVFLARTAF
jgi:hypothetical protein